jgi:hypothetical protein
MGLRQVKDITLDSNPTGIPSTVSASFAVRSTGGPVQLRTTYEIDPSAPIGFGPRGALVQVEFSGENCVVHTKHDRALVAA